MKKLTKLMLITLLSIILAFGALTGCKKNGSKKPDEPDGPVITVELNRTVLGLSVMDEFTLTAVVKKDGVEDKDAEVTWSTSDSAKVTAAPNGKSVKLSAAAAGSADITATSGGKSASCAVTVSADVYPGLYFGAGDSGSFTVLINKTLELQTEVRFNGETQTDAVFSFNSEDENIVTVNSNGVITGVAIGSTDIYVSAEWNGFDGSVLSEILTVTVTDTLSVEIAAPDSTLISTIAPGVLTGYNVPNTVILTGSAFLEDTAVSGSGAALIWESNNPGIASVDYSAGDGTCTVTGVAEGTAEISVSYSNGIKTVKSAPVHIDVEFPIADKTYDDAKLTDVDATDASKPSGYTFSAEKIFGQGLYINSIADITTENIRTFAVDADNEQTTIKNSSLTVGNRIWVVRNQYYGYKIKVSVVTRYITEAGQMQGLFRFTGSSYGAGAIYVLGNNIDASNYTNSASTAYQSTNGTLGFQGTFDGRGHTIEGMTVDTGGFFGNITSGAVIKNVAFTNMTLANSSYEVCPLALNIGGDAVIENVFISIAAVRKTGNNYFRMGAGTIWGAETVKLKNVVIAQLFDSSAGSDFSKLSWNASNGKASFTANFNNGRPAITNVYIVSDITLFPTTDNHSTYTMPVRKATGVNDWDLSALELGALWNLTKEYAEYPVFASYPEIRATVIQNAFNAFDTFDNGVTFYTGESSQIIVPAALGPVTLSLLDTDDSALTVADRTLSIGADVAAGTAKLKITSSFSDSIVKVINIAINAATITADTVYYEFLKSAGDDAELSNESLDSTSGWTLKYKKTADVAFTDADGADYEFSSGKLTVKASLISTLSAATAFNTANYTFRAMKPGGVVIDFNNIMVITKVITTANELAVFRFTAANTNYGAGEYYILGNNIDASGYVHANHATWNSTNGAYGFSGVFDGRGYTIDSVTVGAGGFFGHVSTGGIIKNIAFTNMTVNNPSSGWQTVGFALNIGGKAVVENIFMSVKEVASASSNANMHLFCIFAGGTGTTVKNIVIVQDFTTYSSSLTTASAFMQKMESGNRPGVLANVYIIATLKMYSGNSDTTTTNTSVDGFSPARYDNGAAFAAAKANLAETGLSSTYWEYVSDSYPVFKSAM